MFPSHGTSFFSHYENEIIKILPRSCDRELGLRSPIANTSLKALRLFGFQFRAIHFLQKDFFFFSSPDPRLDIGKENKGFIQIWLGNLHLKLMKIAAADFREAAAEGAAEAKQVFPTPSPTQLASQPA